MIIDYLNKEQLFAFWKTEEEYEQNLFCRAEGFSDITFLNFPNINFAGMALKNCVFKDCEDVSVYGCILEECIYENVSYAYTQSSKLTNCLFDTCCANGTLLTLEAEGEIENCTFRHITVLGEDGHIVHFMYDGKDKVRPLKNCRFEDCEVESKQPILCEYLTTMEVYSPQEIDNVDYNTCLFSK